MYLDELKTIYKRNLKIQQSPNSNQTLAEQYGLSTQTIQRIRKRVLYEPTAEMFQKAKKMQMKYFDRNQEIFEKRKAGVKIKDLQIQYSLSQPSIKLIIRRMKNYYAILNKNS